jgi:hypothetical protein
MVRAWVNVANAVSGGYGSANLEAELAAINTHPGLLNRDHPDHERLVKRRDEIMAQLYK